MSVNRIRMLFDELTERQPSDVSERIGDFTEMMVHHGPDSEWTYDALQRMSGDEREICELACRIRRALLRAWE